MTDDTVNIEVNGVPLKARKGQMLIEVTDAAGIYVPRFCYHPKLSVAANCRMCLVDIEKAPKPAPACATPVMEGMKVFTRSPRAISAQRATMEFLLINHPLDCPICDQGGECELQDLAMGFGRDVSRYTERKRVVKDQNLGPLVSTDMTRCIHCTRCVRFGQEIAGIQELGTTGRGEHMKITTYVEKSVEHELSGNIIDLCPVGALNNKPFRFRARAWEMVAKPLVAPHDCVGSNVYAHVLRGEVRRVVPRDNEAINETWISDRDRFSCHGLYAEDRLTKPMVKRDQEWREVSWQEAIAIAARALRDSTRNEGDALGVLVSPNATLEEMYLVNRIARHLGTHNIDHRLRRRDFDDQAADPAWPWLGTSIEGIEQQQGILVVGSNLRHEVPILAHRVRKAARKGAQIGFVNPARYRYHFPVAAYVESSVAELARALAGVAVAAAQAAGAALPAPIAAATAGLQPTDAERAAAAVLLGRERGLLLLGHIAQRHPAFSEIRAVAAALAAVTGAQLGYIGEGANSAGAALAGLLPHRGVGGEPLRTEGLTVQGMISAPRHAYLLYGFEPDADLANGALAMQALQSADQVVAFASFASRSLLDCADVLLPIAAFAETQGTFVNGEGRWQSFDAAGRTPGEARPGWRVLRVLGNELELPNCEYRTCAEICDALKAELGGAEEGRDNAYRGQLDVGLEPRDARLEDLDVNIYAVDPLVRRSLPLQKTVLARPRAEEPALAEVRTA
ncbi:MAG TPA: NADH-quinone oxidoreductase subunit NuoG [Gammaproteobacteria bacterium]